MPCLCIEQEKRISDKLILKKKKKNSHDLSVVSDHLGLIYKGCKTNQIPAGNFLESLKAVTALVVCRLIYTYPF